MNVMNELYWSIRCELWENRSIFFAPLVVAGVFLFGFGLSTLFLPHRMRLTLDPAEQRAMLTAPYDALAMAVILISFLVAFFYCLDALHGERRDRSILFWKSLPLSDRITVFSKASIPLVVLPAITFTIIKLTQWTMRVMTSEVLTMSGLGAKAWTHRPNTLILFYGLIVIALWHAPIYTWLLLISGWARRAAFLWAVLPLFAIGVLERVAFNTKYFASMLQYRLVGGFAEAFAFKTPHGGIDSLRQLTPGNFLITPGLWVGLFFAAIFLAAAIRLRRNREAI